MAGSPDTPKEVPGSAPPVPVVTGGDTGVGPGETGPQAAVESFDFLDPPRGPDELGRLGDYRVLRVLGRGGMGVVFEAEDPVLHRRLAVKVPLAAADEDFRKRFLREARLAASLPHDHIAAIFQVGQQRGVPFIAMEFLQGESLEDRLRREQTLPVAEALRIAREIAEGLCSAHTHGLIHRDIKPANVWLETRGQDDRVKILDFGVARPVHTVDPITATGMAVGSPGYMSPEQAYALALDARTDLFSLGCVLFRMLCGKLPFGGDNTLAAMQAVAHDPPTPAASVAPGLPAPVLALVSDLLEKDPDKRPATAAAVVERLRRLERELARPDTVAAGTPAPTAPPARPRRPPWGALAGAAVILAAALVGVYALSQKVQDAPGGAKGNAPALAIGPPIKVGLLHSTSGTLAASETPVVEATLLAVDEINSAGGVLGRRIEVVLEDGRSDDLVFAARAEKLIRADGVVTIFGCWSSASRKRVARVCERHNNLLVYPLNYEGLEESPNVIYAGGGPNQQLIPAAGWAVGLLNKHRFFLAGTDSVYSHASNAILKDRLKALKAEVVGEEYVPLHGADGARFARLAERIRASKADAVFNSVDGLQGNVAFFRALSAARIRAADVPCISFSFSEVELRHLSEQDVVGHYAAANYFQSLNTPANRAFVKRFKARYPARSVSDPMEVAYCGVYLWKQAVTQAGGDRPEDIRRAFGGQKFEGPEGLLEIDARTQHARRVARIGRVDTHQSFKIEFVSPEPLPPEPFPPSRSRAQWETFLQGLYRGWGGRWENPAP